MKQTYIEWVHPGSFVSEISTEMVDDRTAPKIVPKRAFGYRFFEQTEVTLSTTGETLYGKPENYSGWTYFGTELTIDVVRETHPDKKILISNMEINGYRKVCHTIFGQFIPIENEDSCITPPTS